MTNLAGLLEDSAWSFPDREAIILGDTRLTYGQVNAASNQVAHLLTSRGVQPGDKVALSCPNLPYFSIVYFGILKAGAVVVPLNVLLKGREVAYHLADSEAKAFFAFEGTADLPIGIEAFAGFEATPGCTDFFVITADPGAEPPIAGTQTLGQGVNGQPPTFDSIAVDDDDNDRRRRGYRDDPRHWGPQTRHDWRGAGPGYRYYRGDHLPYEYRQRRYVIQDWRPYYLYAPPRGYYWVHWGDDFLLVEVATGLIVQILLGN